MEDATLSTISDLLNRTANAGDLPLSAFVAAGVEVCGDDCKDIGEGEADLSDSFSIAWEVRMSYSISKAAGKAGEQKTVLL